MRSSSSSVRLVCTRTLLALAAVVCGCKSASDSNASGVDLTVQAQSLTPAELTSIKLGSLQVTGAETFAKQFDVTPAIGTGELRFKFLPNATVKTGDTLSFHFDALDVSNDVVAAGDSSPVTLAASGATPATISLTATGTLKKGDGVTCQTDTDCGSGFCTDGLCCNERCNEVCASCKENSTKGICVAYAAGTDPETECAGNQSTGAGGHSGAAGAGGTGAGGAGAAPDGGTTADGGPTINPPDAGIMATPQTCTGLCSGMRTCTFPKSGLSCGNSFCNSRKDVASLACDGKGNCAVDLSPCVAYACDYATKACRSQCSANLDCQTDTSYCNGDTNKCETQKADGLTCKTDAECASGHCANLVCCHTACSAPSTCNDSGSAGTCKCPGVACAAGVSCQIFYADSDHDGYGNSSGTLTAGTAVAGCAGSPPAGFVADNTDCDDGDGNVHPGQTAYFGSVSKGTGTYDYNCDGVLEKSIREYPGATCSLCPSCSTGCTTAASKICPGSTAAFQGSLSCATEGALCLGRTIQAADEPISMPILLSVGPPIIVQTQCCGCNDHAGFTTAVGCGATGSYATCGTCAAGSTGALPGTTVGTQQQLCH